MRIKTTKVYEGNKSTATMRSLNGCLLTELDAAFEGVRTREDIGEILRHLRGWSEEMGLDLPLDDVIAACTRSRQ